MVVRAVRVTVDNGMVLAAVIVAVNVLFLVAGAGSSVIAATNLGLAVAYIGARVRVLAGRGSPQGAAVWG